MQRNSTQGQIIGHRRVFLPLSLTIVVLVVVGGLVGQTQPIKASRLLAIDKADVQASASFRRVASGIPDSEYEALKYLYNNTQGNLWFDHAGWMGKGSPCSWYGIVCDADHIVEIYLSSNGLIGNIPEILGQMEALRYLDLSENRLESLPEELGNLIEIAPFVFALPNLSEINWSKDTAVLISAQVQSTPSAQITLTWPLDSNATGYRVYRKSKSDTTWGTPVATPGPAAIAYVETTGYGAAKEYRIEKDVVVPHPTGTPEVYTAYGYIYAGVEVPPTLQRGKVILIVDSNLTTDLRWELVRLKADLIGDGWVVLRHDVMGTDTVSSIKSLIQADYLADPMQVRAVLLFGHVPVPYAGNLVPDGHVPDHRGAWPADVFYGDMDDVATGCQANDIWTDCIVNTDDNTFQGTPAPPDQRNRNIPGDGRFDPSPSDYERIPSEVELEIGRVDLYFLNAFAATETELLRNYLNKDHAFRHKTMTILHDPNIQRGFIANTFDITVKDYDFAASGWRNFAPFFGPANITVADPILYPNYRWDQIVEDVYPPSHFGNQGHLWAFGSGFGTNSSAYHIFSTRRFADYPRVKAVFTMLYGSYFGDWDQFNDFLRAPLASDYILTSSWSGRPHWFFHHMALGETIGYSARLTQNNQGLYRSEPDPTAPDLYLRNVHIALMGDPTLRMHVSAPPGHLLAEVIPISSTFQVRLTWNASPDANLGYVVERIDDVDPFECISADFFPLHSGYVTTTTFLDEHPFLANPWPGPSMYRVRAIQLITSGSGSYHNTSQGIFVSVGQTGFPPC